METKIIEINAPAHVVWSVLISRQHYSQKGGYFSSNWQANSVIEWHGIDGRGNFFGKILRIKPMELFTYIKFDVNQGNKVFSLVSYQTSQLGDKTILKYSEDLMYPISGIKERIFRRQIEKHLAIISELASSVQQTGSLQDNINQLLHTQNLSYETK